VTRRAILGFHAAKAVDLKGNQYPAEAQKATRAIAASYPSPIRDWIERHGGLTRKPIFLYGKALWAMMLILVVNTAHAEMASVYGGRDGYCGSRTANGERVDCSAMTAAHRRLPFGTRVRVCHNGCVTVRINDRGSWVRGRDIDLSPAAARAIGLDSTGRVTVSQL
jgi:rare lipoprotein A